MEYIIDAKNRSLGRIASEAAHVLQGKNDPAYNPRLPGTTRVIIKNAAQIKITGRKMEQKVYYRHSGRPGSLKKRKLGEVFEKDPGEALRRAVLNMLPKNKLRKDRMKRLIID